MPGVKPGVEAPAAGRQLVVPSKTSHHQKLLSKSASTSPAQPSPAQPGAGSGRAEEEAALIELLTVGGCWCTLKLLCTARTLHPAPTPGMLDVDYYLHEAVYNSFNCLEWSLMS